MTWIRSIRVVVTVAQIALLGMVLAASSGVGQDTTRTSPDVSRAEQQLLGLANQDRAKAGAPPLRVDPGLAKAARAHAAKMAERRTLSHQFPGELTLSDRLAADSNLLLDHMGENVAYATRVEQAEDDLMHSPPHRKNLLDPNFNVAGFAVVNAGSMIYVVQDFGHSLPTNSSTEAGAAIGSALNRMRQQANLPPLRIVQDEKLQAAACDMAKSDSLNSPGLQGRTILRFTAMQSDVLPKGAEKAVDSPTVHEALIGTCFARTASYPSGVYWIVLVLN